MRLPIALEIVIAYLIPKPVILQRSVDVELEKALCAEGVFPVLAKIIAARPYPKNHAKGVRAIMSPALSDLSSPYALCDIDRAVPRVVQAILNGETIALETDHDCDGQTAQAVLMTCLHEMFRVPKSCLQTYIGHRLKEGYGLSEALVDRILLANPRPSLVITADNGSSDEPRIAKLKAHGIDVIVTDHHELPKAGSPASALACLNPTRADCNFGDRYIAGCMVAWLLMAAVRARLLEMSHPINPSMGMKDVLDFVAVGTVADCVSMARSANNRAVVRYGLQLIAKAQRPCWQALLPLVSKGEMSFRLSAQDVGFSIAPLLNSDGRLNDALGSVSFLLAESLETALPWAKELWACNQARKEIQARLTQVAMRLAGEQVAQGKESLVVMLIEGHPGVHGISASRVKDTFGRPTILFSPKLGSDELISGSGRSVEEVHLRDALQYVADKQPGLMLAFGGHRGAAGLTLVKARLEEFSVLFEEAILLQLAGKSLYPVLLTDGSLPDECFSLAMLDQLQALEPLGREFEAPLFELSAQLVTWRLVGQGAQHAQLSLQLQNGLRLSGIFFDCCDGASWISRQVKAVVALSEQHFQGQRRLQVRVLSLQEDT